MDPATQLPQELVQWLYNVLVPEYVDVKRTYDDTIVALMRFSTLRPKTDVYTDEQGIPALLLCILGTLPVNYNNQIYHIPVEIWVPKSYPFEAPFAFVRPTQNMAINPTNIVDINGKCYHPYISYWRDHMQNASLSELCDILSQEFGRVPPVYATPPTPVPQIQPQPQLQPSPPRQYIQPESRLPAYSNQSVIETTVERDSPLPAPTPLHPQPQHQPQPQPQSQPQLQPQPQSQYQTPSPSSSLSRQDSAIDASIPRPPPKPPLPPELQAQRALSPQSTGASYISSHAIFPFTSMSHESSLRSSPYRDNYDNSNNTQQLYDSNSYGRQNGERRISVAQPIDQSTGQLHHRAETAKSPQVVDIMSMGNDDESKLSTGRNSGMANEDDQGDNESERAPEKPTDPEKAQLLQSLHNLQTQLFEKKVLPQQAQMNRTIEEFENEVSHMENESANEIQRLSNINQTCDQNQMILKEKIDQAKSVINEIDSRGQPDIDDIVCADTVVFNQLYELVADDQAIDDTIYALSKALDRDRLKLDMFMRHTRSLAREQFMKKALILKIAQTTGLV